MDTFDFILTVLTSAVPLLIALLTFVIKFVKNKKANNVLKKTLLLTEALQDYIVEAEAFKNYTGIEKKQFVLTKANQFSIDHKIKFDELAVSDMVDQLVGVTKKVNMRDKDRIDLSEGKDVSGIESAVSIL